MIRPFACQALLLLLISSAPMLADSYRLRTGELIEGDPISFDARGVVFKQPDQTFSPRTGWTNFTEVALKRLGEFPEGQKFVEEYLIEEDQPEQEVAELDIKPREHP